MSVKTSKKEVEMDKLQNSVQRIILMCSLAAALRYWLMLSKYQSVIANHVEVSTPMNSWKRVSEGLYLLSRNIDPYSGDLLHETPLSLFFYKVLLNVFQQQIHWMFITFDLATGILLFATARKYMSQLYKEENANKSTFSKDALQYLLKPTDLIKSPFHVLLAFLFNPFTLFNCVGYSTTVFHNLFLSLLLFSMVLGIPIIGSVSLALSASMSFYPSILIIPISLYHINIFKSVTKAIIDIIIFIVSVSLITIFCSHYAKDFGYLKNVYGCILTVPDLQPNIGLFWYFFTEMFDHFRDLFIYSFQINATLLYLVPLSIKFRKQPFLLTLALLFIITVFKSYPCVGDVGFVLSLLPCFVHLLNYCQQGFLVGVIFLIASSLAPILWYLWIYCNSANANFYFGVTLAFAIAQIFLLTDVLFAQVKREFILEHGKERKVNGEEGILCLE
ncbi:hypothetical protein NQ314_004553 [Rhamnusium bicolor]|uniref:Phosphatidylinositol glycan anchor biosynthesis class U protein n=1 Tax=Rhamnusium bicolor TaxID=1586634 RepID=A0AAV8ZLL6_9CUCU|nr:hypothetical protein NQ314_004553 [Rhamnusium bicolor]